MNIVNLKSQSSSGRGFTLVELLIAITLSTIIGASVIYVLQAGLDAWEYGQGQALCQMSAETAVAKIMEGDYFYDGLREALEITRAGETEVEFVPWYVQKLGRVVPGEKYRLERAFLVGSAKPVGEVFDPAKKAFEYRQLEYFLEKKVGQRSEFVRFQIDKPFEDARVIYYADPRGSKDVVMRIFFDPGRHMIFRSYLGQEKPLFRGEANITGLNMQYYNNSNDPVDARKIDMKKSLTTPITAVRVEVTTESGSETYTLPSFVNMRKKGIAGSGVYLTEKATVRIPDSKNVKILTLTNFGGIQGRSQVAVTIYSEMQTAESWAVKIEFDNVGGVGYITTYSVEYPAGQVVLKKDINRPADQGLNLMTIDSAGLYDYDDDRDVEDFVDFEGDDIILSVERMDIGGMNLFVR